ncbi:MAG TPA: nuclear transport factor 2 family protein [Actinophytocola sp.]|nr:nuclear transport factor 2 family protein [Actinophytocola sp.]
MSSTAEFVARVEDYFLGRDQNHDLWAEDVVIETPFAPARRHEGRQRFLDETRESRESLPVRFDEMRDVTVHEAGDTLVLEYELAGTVLTTGRQASARFVVVARLRDGQVTHWREYPDTAAIAAVLGGS